MQNKILIVCFDTPYPTNYGGVIDIERKFKYFQTIGVKVDLICTCFDMDRKIYFENFVKSNDTIIDNYHIELINISISKFPKLFNLKPFSVEVRAIDFSQIDFLQSENYQLVLVEHMKTTKCVNELIEIFNQRNLTPEFWLRLHNDETAYYKNMYLASKGIKKLFFLSESLKYKFYEPKILNSNLFKGFLYISEKDQLFFQEKSRLEAIHQLLPIYQSESVSENKFTKNIDFFYVGNLDLDDNLSALQKINSFLVKHNLYNYKIVIAGKCSTTKRESLVKNNFTLFENIVFEFNISKEKLSNLYQESKFFLNFSNNESGVKTKLIEALENNIPVISDFEGADGSGYENDILKSDEIETNYLIELLNSTQSYSDYLDKFISRIKIKEVEVVKYYANWFK